MALKRTPDRKAVSAVSDVFNEMQRGATVLAACCVADRAGLWKVMAENSDAEGGKFITVDEISSIGKLHPRYVTEICGSLACAGLLQYDEEKDGFAIDSATAKITADDSFALTFGGNFDRMPAMYQAVPGVAQAMMTPEKMTGVDFKDIAQWGYSRYMERAGVGVAKPYVNNWLPTGLPEVTEQLKAGGMNVAEVGCGAGRITVALAQAFPKTKFTGIELDPTQFAKAQAMNPGLTNLEFQNRDMATIEEGTYDFVVNHDCIHDLVDPLLGLTQIRKALKPGGLFFSMEPRAGEDIKQRYKQATANGGKNRMMIASGYAGSCMYCMTVSCAHGGVGLGSATFGPKKYEAIARQAGFTEFKIVGNSAINNHYVMSAGKSSL